MLNKLCMHKCKRGNDALRPHFKLFSCHIQWLRIKCKTVFFFFNNKKCTNKKKH